MKTLFHVTDLDSMIWYHKMESMTLEEMRGRLLRTSEPSEKMSIGSAWHKILENPPDIIETIEIDGIKFKVECESTITVSQVKEIRATKEYLVDGVQVILTGGCDGISGNKITDHKLTFRPDPENYMESFQWRAYLDIYGADVFEYIIYPAIEKKGVIIIRDISTMTLYRYPEMEEDLKEGIRDLLNFCKDHVQEKFTVEKRLRELA